MTKELKVDLRDIQNHSLLELEKVIVMYGFSYHACKTCNVSRVDTLTGYQIILFNDLDKKIKENLSVYHDLYMQSITKKCVDDLYHLLEALIINSWKEVRKIPFKVSDDIRKEYNEFLGDKYDVSIWRMIRFVGQLNFHFSSEIKGFLDNLKNLRKSLHDGNVLKQDVTLAYKGFDIRCFGKQSDNIIEIGLDDVIDASKYGEGSIYFEYGKSLVDRTKDFKMGFIPEFKPNEFQELCPTLQSYIIPEINKTFANFLKSSCNISNIKYTEIR